MTVSPVAERVTESFLDGASVSSAETYPNIDPSTGATLGCGGHGHGVAFLSGAGVARH